MNGLSMMMWEIESTQCIQFVNGKLGNMRYHAECVFRLTPVKVVDDWLPEAASDTAAAAEIEYYHSVVCFLTCFCLKAMQEPEI